MSRTEKKSFVDRITAREYYVMARKGNRGMYLRAGRFFAPFGLRSQNHTDYVRRFLGFHSLEETLNLSVGNVDNDHEWHVTAHAATPYDLQGNGPRGLVRPGRRDLRWPVRKPTSGGAVRSGG